MIYVVLSYLGPNLWDFYSSKKSFPPIDAIQYPVLMEAR